MDMKFSPWDVALELTKLHSAFQSLRHAIRSWSMFIPPGVVERLLRTELEATIGVANCHVTILFCDIDGFEDACRGLSPSRVLSLLSDVLGKIADVIQASEGTLLEFIADEVLAVFNTPNFLKNHAYYAMAAAIEIHRVVGHLPRITLETGKDTSIRCRVGINTSQVFAGNLGSTSRMKYGLLGDGVNSRYGTRTLVSASMVSKSCMQRVVTRPVDVVAVKGKKQSISTYEVLGTRSSCSPDVQQAAQKHTEAFRLYHQRRFAEAKQKFEEVTPLMKEVDASDGVSTLLTRRCAYYMQHPPDCDWDGVERLMQKSWQDAPVGNNRRNKCAGSDSSTAEQDGLGEEDECVADGWASGFHSDTRSSGDTLRDVGEGIEHPSQPLCFCEWPRWLQDLPSYLPLCLVQAQAIKDTCKPDKCDL